jgi:hypothetical protein
MDTPFSVVEKTDAWDVMRPIGTVNGALRKQRVLQCGLGNRFGGGLGVVLVLGGGGRRVLGVLLRGCLLRRRRRLLSLLS